MSYLLIITIFTVYSIGLSYGMFKLGYNTGFQKAYYYALLMQKAKKKLDEDSIF